MTAVFMPWLLFAFASWVIVIAFIVLWVRNARESRQYLQAGLIVVAIFFALESVVLHTSDVGALPMSLSAIFFMLGIATVRLCSAAVVGLLFAERLTRAFDEAEPSGAAQHSVARYGLFKPSRHGVRFALVAVLFMLAYSSALFRLTGASPSAVIQQHAGSNIEIQFFHVLAVVSAGFAEEIIYRLGLQNTLTYWWRNSSYGHYWAIAVTSAMWSAGHMGAVDPGWVKITQVFVFGIILGHLNRRYGIGACILVHTVFNATMAMFSKQLIGL